MTLLGEIEETVAGVAAAQGRAVVGIGTGWRVASGFVAADGRVLTSAHRVGGGEVAVRFADGRSATGAVGAADRDLGLALVEVDTADVEPLGWAAGELRAGAAVVALARPGERGLRASLGFVVATERRLRGARGRPVEGAIEHSTALPRGSAGGPLLDASGGLVGINLLRVEGGLIVALGGSARERIERLVGGESAEPRYLGVAVAPPRVARRLQRALGLPEREGVLVRAVEGGTPAARAGLERGDLIVAAAGADLEGIDALHEAIAGAPGRLALTVVRGAEEREVEVDLGAEKEPA
ncbi:MAG TPA: trypsin-like peptidase domain-containing protein [Solirubrobacterales bacterium]|nr:trypsin-like peptidase domain-containing protein [Solirubrobacterales bacterium]